MRQRYCVFLSPLFFSRYRRGSRPARSSRAWQGHPSFSGAELAPTSPPTRARQAKVLHTGGRCSQERWIWNCIQVCKYLLYFKAHTHISCILNFSGYATSHEFTGLNVLTQYRYRVRAINDVGPGPWSPVVTVATTSECTHYRLLTLQHITQARTCV